ncbi:MAG: hypothetical protein H7Z14_09390 [Anaerolineae bacterium]|nr:hypothetical protein [Phycisphaerae bacterium]
MPDAPILNYSPTQPSTASRIAMTTALGAIIVATAGLGAFVGYVTTPRRYLSAVAIHYGRTQVYPGEFGSDTFMSAAPDLAAKEFTDQVREDLVHSKMPSSAVSALVDAVELTDERNGMIIVRLTSNDPKQGDLVVESFAQNAEWRGFGFATTGARRATRLPTKPARAIAGGCIGLATGIVVLRCWRRGQGAYHREIFSSKHRVRICVKD